MSVETPLSDHGLTPDEQDCADSIVLAYSRFSKLHQQHPNELPEFVSSINNLQGLLAMRVARREYPEGWPIHNKGNQDD